MSILDSISILLEFCSYVSCAGIFGSLRPEKSGKPIVYNLRPTVLTVQIRQRDKNFLWFGVFPGAALLWIFVPAGEATPAASPSTLAVGTWNLEYFGRRVIRGDPETRVGGPRYTPRRCADYAYIAGLIKKIDAKVLALQEIYAYRSRGRTYRSVGLNRLVWKLGRKRWAYRVGRSGRRQHLAFLYDRKAVRAKAFCEARFPWKMVDGQNLFYRQPLAGYFKLLHNGKEMNDFVIINLHLVSGLHRTHNHDLAVKKLLGEIRRRRWFRRCIPAGERDIVIAGDLNANRFDLFQERFWDRLEKNGWDVLADSPARYPPTRLSGVPLRLRTSRLDYIIVTRGNGGLAGEEIRQKTARVHTDLVGPSPTVFRRRASDHLPVTVRIRSVRDRD